MSARPVLPLPPEVLITAEEFLEFPGPSLGKQELHDGRIVEMPPPAPRHSVVQQRLVRSLGNWCDAHGLGEPAVELGCRLGRLRVLVPDVAYVRPGPRWEAALAASALDGPPDLAAEVVSPSDTRRDGRKKAQWYLEAGCPLVWVIDPQRRTATVYRPTGVTGPLGDGDALEGEDILPGFRLPLLDLWGGLGQR